MNDYQKFLWKSVLTGIVLPYLGFIAMIVVINLALQ